MLSGYLVLECKEMKKTRIERKKNNDKYHKWYDKIIKFVKKWKNNKKQVYKYKNKYFNINNIKCFYPIIQFG